MYRHFFRPLLFRLNPERAHALTLRLIRLAGSLPPVAAGLRRWFQPRSRPVQAFGLTFTNPVGLAAGYDKDGLGWRGLACLGFSHIEIGTVTVRPQEGNPRPRVFRLVEDGAVINRMGFPGRGADFVLQQLQGARPHGLVLGVNLGKNKSRPLEEAAVDYQELVQTFAPLADYLAINVSSPNTVGLRRLQGRDLLQGLLTAAVAARQAAAPTANWRPPLLVKLAPDLSDEELDDALDVIQSTGMDGVIATNTTLDRAGLRSPRAAETGGLSGAPLRACSTEMIRQIHQRTQGKLPIIGVGGIASPADAQEKLEAGAVLVQVYTGLIYAGPGLVKEIVNRMTRI
jgi:dihydroorotate dehydrogenase